MSTKRLAILFGLAALLLLGARSSLAATTPSPLPNKYLYTIGAQPSVGAFHNTRAIAVAPTGDIYLTDAGGSRVQRFTSQREFVAAWGTLGDGDAQFIRPTRLAVGPDNTVYVGDSARHDIQRFTPTGTLLNRWGSRGRGPGQFGREGYGGGAVSLAVAADGTVYAADEYNSRIQYFTPTGQFLGQWDVRDSAGHFLWLTSLAIAPNGTLYVGATNPDGDALQSILAYTAAGVSLGGWGPSGEGPGEFDYVEAIAVGLDGDVYVVDNHNERIQVFTPTGDLSLQWQAPGWIDALAAAPNNTLYYADAYQDRIMHVAPNGMLLDTWLGRPPDRGEVLGMFTIAAAPDATLYVGRYDSPRVQHFDAAGRFLDAWDNSASGSSGSAPPSGISVTPAGVVYVSEEWTARILYFDPTGTFLGAWGQWGDGDGMFRAVRDVAVAPDGTIYVTDAGNFRIQHFTAAGQFLNKWGSQGDQDGQFDWPGGIAVSPGQVVYVADSNNHRIQRFTADGQYLNQWNAGTPRDIAIAPDGTVYVADSDHDRILRYTAEGQYLGQWGSQGSGEGEFNDPSGVAVGPDGAVYVADDGNDRVQVFGPTVSPTWRAEYYGNRWLAERPQVITQTADIAFDWGFSPPDPDLPTDGSSARFTRSVPFDAGLYRFTVAAQGGVRLWADGRLLVDAWDGPTVAATRIAALGPGEGRLRLEYNDVGGRASVHLTWQPLALSSRLFLPHIAARPE